MEGLGGEMEVEFAVSRGGTGGGEKGAVDGY